jgi:acyl carrier protein
MLHERLEELLEGILNQSVILTDDTIIGSLPGWDSVAQINLVLSMEVEFGVQFSNLDDCDLESIGALKHLLRQRMATPGSARLANL